VRQRWFPAFLALVGVALMWLGTQTVGEGTEAPRNKVLVAAWLETKLWVNPWLLVGGLVLFIAAVVLVAVNRRRRARGPAA
jgi:hypothetical protein